MYTEFKKEHITKLKKTATSPGLFRDLKVPFWEIISVLDLQALLKNLNKLLRSYQKYYYFLLISRAAKLFVPQYYI